MKHKLQMYLSTILAVLQGHKKLLTWVIVFIILVPVILMIVSHLIVSNSTKYILTASSTKHERVGLVLGAGVDKQGKP